MIAQPQNPLVGKKILVVEQGFLNTKAFEFLNSKNIEAEFLYIAPAKPFKRKIYHKYLNIFYNLILKKRDYLPTQEFNYLNKQFLNQVKNKITGKYDYILIIRPDNFNKKFLDYISQYNKERKLYGYLWDGLSKKKAYNLAQTRNLFHSLYCFDRESISQYSSLNLQYSTNFYYPIEDLVELSKTNKEIDCLTISYTGQLANRRDLIIEEILDSIPQNEIKFKTDVTVVLLPGTSKNDLSVRYNFNYIYHRISIEDYLKKSIEADVVLDIQIDYQKGLTFRIFEITFYKKKMITTNPLVKELEFYHPDNIFIYSEETKHQLPEFFKKPYNESNYHHIFPYQFDNWLARIMQD